MERISSALSEQKEISISPKQIVVWMILVVLIVMFSVLFVVPRMGAANNGDYYRFAERVGVDGFSYNGDHIIFFDKVYENGRWKPMDTSLLTPAKQSFGNVWLVTLIRGLTNLFSDTSCTTFSTLYLAVVYAIMLMIAATTLLYCAVHRWGKRAVWFSLLGVVMLMGSMHLAWFNSLYGEALLYVGLLLSLAFVCALVLLSLSTWKTFLLLMVFFASNYLFLTAKPQGVLAWPFWVLMLIFVVIHLCRTCFAVKWAKILCIVLTVVYCCYSGYSCLRLYQWNNEYNEKDTLYSSLMFGALMLTDSDEEAEEMLKDMGLAPELALDKGNHAYVPASELHVPPRSEKAQELIYDKISTFDVLKYYLTHPSYLWEALEITAEHAVNPATSLLMFVAEDAKKYGEVQQKFALWEEIRPYLVPHHFWQYIVVYLTLFSIVIRSWVRHKQNKKHCLLLLLYLTIMCTGIIQFPLPFIGNGYADTNKQLYLFMLCWDITMLIAVCWGGCILTQYLRKLRHIFGERGMQHV